MCGMGFSGDVESRSTKRIERLLQRLEKKLDAADQQATSNAVLLARVDRICKAVYGDGRVSAGPMYGLMARVARLETARRFWANVSAGTLGLLSGALLAMLAWLLGK